MLLESFNICQNVAENNNVEYDFIKSINDNIFKGLNKKIRKADTLIISFAPFGNFYFRDKKTKAKIGYKRPHGKIYEGDDEFEEALKKIQDLYKEYYEDNLKFKYEKFGKKSHDAFILAKKTQRIPFSEKTKST